MVDPEMSFKPREVADVLNCSLTNVYDLMRSGQVARTKVGPGKKGYRVCGSDLIAFIKEAT